MRLLTWLDWFNVLSILPLSDPRAHAAAPHLTREQLMEAIHCVAADGKIHRGARCLRFLGMRLPLLVPVALILWIPGVIQVASRHRLFLSRLFGCKGACTLLSEKHRSSSHLES